MLKYVNNTSQNVGTVNAEKVILGSYKAQLLEKLKCSPGYVNAEPIHIKDCWNTIKIFDILTERLGDLKVNSTMLKDACNIVDSITGSDLCESCVDDCMKKLKNFLWMYLNIFVERNILDFQLAIKTFNVMTSSINSNFTIEE